MITVNVYVNVELHHITGSHTVTIWAPADMNGVLMRERGFREEALETVSASLGSSPSLQPRLRLPSEALEASTSCSELRWPGVALSGDASLKRTMRSSPGTCCTSRDS